MATVANVHNMAGGSNLWLRSKCAHIQADEDKPRASPETAKWGFWKLVLGPQMYLNLTLIEV